MNRPKGFFTIERGARSLPPKPDEKITCPCGTEGMKKKDFRGKKICPKCQWKEKKENRNPFI